GDVAAGAVDVEVDGLAAVICQLAEPLDRDASDVFLDVADQVDVAQAIGLLLPQQVLYRIHQFAEQPFIELAHRAELLHAACRRVRNVTDELATGARGASRPGPRTFRR